MSIEFGLTSAGFNRERLDQIVEEIEQEILNRFGPMNMEPDSFLGQLIGVFAKREADLWEQLEFVYQSQYPSTAEGTALDNAVELIGVQRLAATKSRVTLALTGAQGTLIPAGSIVKTADTDDLFVNPQDGIITQSNALKAVIDVGITLSNQLYSVSLNNVTYEYTSDPSATENEIRDGLIAAINDNDDGVTATSTNPGELTLTSDDLETTFSVISGDNLTIPSRTSPVEFEAQSTGPTMVLAGTISEITTPVSGWTSVTNYLEGVIGRNTESDEALRIRRNQSTKLLGAASVEAIKARLRQNVQDVTNVLVFENKLPTTDGSGRPPHSFEAVVVGGDEDEIAMEIWQAKAAGIQTWGNTSVLITDSNGDLQEIKFSRPEPVYVWVNVVVTPLDEDNFPDTGFDDIKAAIMDYVEANFGVGDDIIYQQLYGPVYEVMGDHVLSIAVTLATSATEEGPAGAYSAANVDIAEVEIGDFALDRINVEFAP